MWQWNILHYRVTRNVFCLEGGAKSVFDMGSGQEISILFNLLNYIVEGIGCKDILDLYSLVLLGKSLVLISGLMMPSLLGHHEPLGVYGFILFGNEYLYSAYTHYSTLRVLEICSRKPRLTHSGGCKQPNPSQYTMPLIVRSATS